MKITKNKSEIQFETDHLPITTEVLMLQPAFPGPESTKLGLHFKFIYTISEQTALHMTIDCTVFTILEELQFPHHKKTCNVHCTQDYRPYLGSHTAY
jgi:hypothetical protein